MPPVTKKQKRSERNELRDELITSRIEYLGVEIIHLSAEVATAHTVEYLRFMDLKSIHDIEGMPSTLAPSFKVGQLWHVHLWDTISYQMLEKLLLPDGTRIHLNPIKKEQPFYEERLLKTLQHYRDAYDAEPPAGIWANSKAGVVITPPRANSKAEVAASLPNDIIKKADIEKIKTGVVTIQVISESQSPFMVNCRHSLTVTKLKNVIAAKLGVEDTNFCMIFDNEDMDEGPTTRLAYFDMEDTDIITIVKELKGR